MTRIRLAALLLLASCGAPAAAPAPSPAPTATAPAAPATASSSAPTTPPRRSDMLDKKVARTLDEVSRLRGLVATKAVPGVQLLRRDMVAAVKEKALREYPPEALAREGKILQLLDFAPTTFDYLGETLRLLEAQLEGYYEPKNGAMYMASELKGAEAEATLAHELVHALQDQHYDLKTRSDYKPGQSDRTMGLAVLAEGDATSLMMDVVLAKQGVADATALPDAMLRETMEAAMSMGDVATVPHVLKASLVAPYVEGITFVNALRRKGGWPAVDRVWVRLPVSTEQVLHVDKWETNEAPLDVAAPTARALGPGFVLQDEDTSGELGYALMFGEWMAAADARTLAAHWGGDRAAFFANGETIAIGEHLVYDAGPGPFPHANASAAFDGVARGLGRRYGKATINTGTFVCFERADTGPLAVARMGRDLVFTAGPARSGTTWASAGTCKLARSWTNEIFRAGL